MVFALVLAAMIAQRDTPAPSKNLTAQLSDPLTGVANAMLMQRSERLTPAKLSPKVFAGKKWEFDWLTAGYATSNHEGQMDLRFRVFSQERKVGNDVALNVAMMDLRMWQMIHHKYKIDHRDMGNNLKIVDQYLCWGGTAGGEQTLGEDTEEGIPRRVNTIYIYDIASFKNPLEMAREVAHEYGHAVLPAVGGFKSPEDWANGYLGEKLFLRWMRDTWETGTIESHAVMGASFDSLDGWVKRNVDPLVIDASTHAPDKKILASKGQKAMNAYMGLVLYADTMLPDNVVARSLKLNGSTSAADYPEALVDAASEGSFTVNVPNMLLGNKLWLPVGKSKVQGGKIIARSGAWAQVQPTVGPLTVIAPQS